MQILNCRMQSEMRPELQMSTTKRKDPDEITPSECDRLDFVGDMFHTCMNDLRHMIDVLDDPKSFSKHRKRFENSLEKAFSAYDDMRAQNEKKREN